MAYSIKNSYYELACFREFGLYAQKAIRDRAKQPLDSPSADLFSDLVAVSFLGKLQTPLLSLFPYLSIPLVTETIKFDTFVNEHVNEHYEASWKIIARYVSDYKIKHTRHPYYGKPSFQPIVKPFEEIDKIVPENIKLQYKWYRPYTYTTGNFEKAIFIEKVLRLELLSIRDEAESTFRAYLGLKPKSPRWISEQALYDRIKLRFQKLTIVSQASPEWLGRQRFDIYIPEINAAIEYNGLQHYKAVGLFGGHEGLKQTQARDEEKRKKCTQNDCALLEVNENYSFEEIVCWIENVMKSKHG